MRLAVLASGRGTALMLVVELGAAVLVCLFGLALLTGYAVSERLLPADGRLRSGRRLRLNAAGEDAMATTSSAR